MKISQWEFNEWKPVVNGNSMHKKKTNSNGNDSDFTIPLHNHKNL